MIKVAVHITPRYTRAGHKTSWSNYQVFSGTNPFGPQGGRCSDCVDGELEAGPFSHRIKAIKVAQALAAKNGWEFAASETDARHLEDDARWSANAVAAK